MDLDRIKAEALKLSFKERLELAQSLLQSFYSETVQSAKPRVIDSAPVPNPESSFELEADPRVTVDQVSQAPRAIALEGREGFNPEAESGKSEKTVLDSSSSISESFEKLRRALEGKSESS